jgi:2-polyprenyl-3-methyl-5-hydroxy-6-metoxy-1,4-benzoquinol methylase
VQHILLKRLQKGCNTIALNEIQNYYINVFREKVKNNEYQLEQFPCLCGAHADKMVAEVDRYGFVITTVICLSCGLVRSDPYYTEDTLRKFYNNEYRQIYVGEERCSEDFFNQQQDFGDKIYSYVSDLLPKAGNTTVYEIGCGAGGILKAFMDRGFSTVGTDFGREYLDYGRSQGLNLIEGSQQELCSFGQADVIIMNHVLEHIKDPVSYLRMLKPMLKSDGLLYVAVPGIHVIPRWYSGDILMYLQNAHAYHFTVNTLRYVLSLAGFKMIRENNYIQAVFRVSDEKLVSHPNSSEAENIIKFLEQLERKVRRKQYVKNILYKIIPKSLR